MIVSNAVTGLVLLFDDAFLYTELKSNRQACEIHNFDYNRASDFRTRTLIGGEMK